MKRVSIDEAVPGMSLAKPATNSTGQTLVGAGTELDETLIARLQQMGVAMVYVKEPSDEGGAQAERLARLEQELDHRFRKAAGDPASEMIREVIRRHLHATHGGQPAVEESRP
ncbi:MAG: hypothetical protein FJ249_10715 [Nitrospira sp.]|nr:hypothetical protein [Nitrospira sp.]